MTSALYIKSSERIAFFPRDVSEGPSIHVRVKVTFDIPSAPKRETAAVMWRDAFNNTTLRIDYTRLH